MPITPTKESFLKPLLRPSFPPHPSFPLKYFKSVFAVSTAPGAAAEGSVVLLSTAPRYNQLHQLTPLIFFHLTKGRAPALTPCSNVSDRVTQSRPDPSITALLVHRQPPTLPWPPGHRAACRVTWGSAWLLGGRRGPRRPHLTPVAPAGPECLHQGLNQPAPP